MRRVQVGLQPGIRFDPEDVTRSGDGFYRTRRDPGRVAPAYPEPTAPIQIDTNQTADFGVGAGTAFDRDVPQGQVLNGADETLREFTTSRLRDGALVFLRPLHDGETEPVLEVFEGLSPTSRYLRFLAPMPRLPSTVLRSLTRLDQCNRVAWGVRTDHQWVGIGRYVRLPDDPSTAELALSVVDAHQRRGLGRLLVETLAAVGAASGVRTFDWHVHPENHKASALVRSLGGRPQLTGGVWEARLSLPPLVNTGIDHAEIVRLAASACSDQVPAAA